MGAKGVPETNHSMIMSMATYIALIGAIMICEREDVVSREEPLYHLLVVVVFFPVIVMMALSWKWFRDELFEILGDFWQR